jgi:hypothetical protein
MDPEIAKRAKHIAHARRTNVSALVEELVRNASGATAQKQESFVDRWRGRLRVRSPKRADPRLIALKRRYDLE